MVENPKWDAFTSHAAEDKDSFVRPLAIAVQSLGAAIWYDELTFGGFTQSPCPSDPNFPALEGYDLQFHESRGASYVQWIRSVFPKTRMARLLRIMDGVSSTREEAEQRLRHNYARRSKKWGGR